ncbi:MAG TPA: FAD-dependent oxidoreductase, partial [Phycisphaerales bacterium]|nr:FAD-dependent oxidoreductase [Phycisphaerales bacterium]
MTRDDRAPWGEIAGLGDIAGWDGPSEIDVCVAGAGIAGLTTAYLLLEEGKRVLVLDQEGPGAGETGRTSAHLADVIDDRFSRLATRFGVEGAKTLHESHRAAIGMIERIVEREGIDCEFRRIPGYLCVAESRELDLLGEEESAARRICAGSLERVAHPPGLPGLGASLRFEGQARFHPLKYLAGLVRAIVQRGGRCIFGPTARVVDMKG